MKNSVNYLNILRKRKKGLLVTMFHGQRLAQE